MTRTPRPRGRPRKGSTRMDAALDAMRCYGFSDDLIVSTVKDLLKTYGVEGWPCIEDSSYKVLLEAILEKVENQEQGKSNAFQDNERHENSIKILAGNHAEISAAGPASGAPLSTCQDKEAIAVAFQTNEALHSVSQAGNILDTALSNGNASFSAPGGDGSRWKDIELYQHCMKQRTNDDRVFSVVKFDGVEELGDNGLSTLQPLNCLLPHRRRPCHGWIGSDDDDEDDLVDLPLAPFAAAIAQFLFAADRARNPKRKWDVKPDDA